MWAQFCGLHQAACVALSNGTSHVDFDVVDRQYVKEKLVESLHSEDGGYDSMRNESWMTLASNRSVPDNAT